MAGFLENIVCSIFIISTIRSHVGAEHAILACGFGEQYAKYLSKTPANECELLQFLEVPMTGAEVCRKLNNIQVAEDLKTNVSEICEPDYQDINQHYADRDFTNINKKLKTTFRIKVNETTKLWEIEINCTNPKYGNITCRRREANLTIWITGFDQEQKEFIHQTIEISRLSNTANVTSGEDEGQQNTPHQEKSEHDDNLQAGFSMKGFVTGISIGFICGLSFAIFIAWNQGTNIQRFFKPFRYHMTLTPSKTERKTTDQITRFPPAYNYMECATMKTVELPCKAESILDVARFEEYILSVSGRGTYIDKSSIPHANVNRSRVWNALMSCFCCQSTLGDHAVNVPEDIRYPWSMAVDSLNKCVYVSGYQNDIICRIPLVQGENAPPSKKWSVFSGQKPAAVQVSVSMENNGNIIVVSLEVNGLEEYNSNGELKRIELENNDDYAHIQHAIKRTDGNYVLVHGWKEDKYHRVCLVDGKGRLKASYGHSKGDAIGDAGQLNTPTHLAVDKNNFVLVTDYNNHRIILLDPDLKFVKVLITHEAGLYRPCRLILDEREQGGDEAVRLFVGEDRKEPKARIMVFFLKRREAFKYPESVPLTSVESSTTE